MHRKTSMTFGRREFLAGVAGVCASVPFIPQSFAQPIRRTAVPRSARDRLEEALARIADPKGEGNRTCLTVYTEAARAAADASDARTRAGISLGPVDGTIVSIKDLFDVAGEPTRAGSSILKDAPPASADAVAVRRLRAGGAVIVAKTNMSEFAFSGLGANPHYGTPANPADRTRVPGGSSSGAAVAVADGMCEIGIGSDTGGSTRIPAALCGVVGYKPSKYRIPADGAFPLSFTLDSIGPLAKSVRDCAAADAAMANEEAWTVEDAPLGGLRLGIPQGLPLTNVDQTVAARFSEAAGPLTRAGVRLTDEQIPLLDDVAHVYARGTITSVEAYSVHREWLATRGSEYDSNIRGRIEAGGKILAADYVTMLRERLRLVRAMDARLADLDGLVLPTTPIVAPTIAEVAGEGFASRNLLVLRNPTLVNFFDLCAISIPLPRSSGLPVGLMIVARNGEDRKLFRIAAAVERLFAA
jgi:aspartyl-tRNA(Asn)/glutamyl-tRNA(Gln) amidotransferase subunit A